MPLKKVFGGDLRNIFVVLSLSLFTFLVLLLFRAFSSSRLHQ